MVYSWVVTAKLNPIDSTKNNCFGRGVGTSHEE
jgi:hypothetical protein